MLTETNQLAPSLCIIFCIILITGCTWCADKRIVVKPEPEPRDYRNRWMALAYFCEKHFDTTGWTTEEIAAELSLAQYYIDTNKPTD